MSTWLAQNVTLNRQEGDDSDIVLDIDPIIDLSAAEIKLQVWTNPVDADVERELIFEKDNDVIGGIEVDEQIITVTIIPEDTKGFSGVQKWELQIKDDLLYGTKTIAKGKFNIISELID